MNGILEQKVCIYVVSYLYKIKYKINLNEI